MIYAFKSGNRAQTLREHIKQCMEGLEKIKRTKIWQYFLSLFDCYGEKEIEKFVKCVLTFHDIGKVCYQKDKEELSFKGHEAISAYLFCECTNFDEELKELGISAILFHHHSMNVIRRIEIERRDILFSTEIIDELEDELNDYRGIINIACVKNELKNIDIHQVRRFCGGIIKNYFWSKFHANFSRKFLLLLSILIFCDYYRCSEYRKTKKTTFENDLEVLLVY